MNLQILPLISLPADSFSMYEIKVIPNKVRIMKVFNCVKFHYAHFVRNYFKFIPLIVFFAFTRISVIDRSTRT